MGTERKELALAKVLAAAAWADGRLENDETNAIKDCMLHLGLTGDEISQVSQLLESPVSRTQAEQLTASFLEKIHDDRDKQELLALLNAILNADGEVSEDEHEFLAMVREVVESHSVLDMVLDRVRGLFTWGALRPKGERSSPVADMMRTKLQGRIREKLRDLSSEATADAERLNRATLFGALLQRIACADKVTTEEEAARIGALIREKFGFEDDEIATIHATLCEQVTGDVNLHRLAVEFNRVSDLALRMDLLTAMFEVAAADHEISAHEVDEIRRIADYLWIDRREFNDVRLRYAKGE